VTYWLAVATGFISFILAALSALTNENRIELSVGRDITLEPRQAAPPLNYFVYPYAELDGSPVRDVEKRFYFKDLPSGS